MEGFIYETSESAVLNFATAVSLVFRPVTPVEIVRYGVLSSVVFATASLIITGNHRQLGGAALTPSGAAALGTCTTTTANGTLGGGTYTEVVNDVATFAKAGGQDIAGSTTAVDTKPFLVIPGEEVEFIVSDNTVTGSGIIWCMFRRLGFQPNTTYRNRAAITAPVADSNWLVAYEKVTS